nr:uncharacterized mitochondrial protein AtMg00810-like [Tanacetum cinerariifolium]
MILNTLDNLRKFEEKKDEGTKDAASQEVKKNVSSLRYIALPNWAHDALLEYSSSKPQDHCSTKVPKGSGNLNPTASTSNPLADQMETLTVETPIPTVSSPVPTAYSTDSQEPSSDVRLISKRVANQVGTPSLDNILSLTNRFGDILIVTTNSDESNGVEADISNMETAITASPTPILRIHKDHPKGQIIGPMDTSIQTKNKSKEVEEQSFIATIYQKTDPALLQFYLFSCFLSQVEPKMIYDALQDPSWVEAMQEDLLQFKIQNVWTLVNCPKGVRPIGTKWVLKNKKDERRIVIRNKARLVAQGHTQEEGIDYNEVFIPVARIEAIKLFLAYASFMGFTVYQMDVKSAFLYGTIDEEVEFEALMHEKFQMSAMGELNFFLSLQVLQKDDGIFLSQDKKKTGLEKMYRSPIGSLMYLTASRPDIMFAVCACVRHQVTPKECHMHAVKMIFRYLKGHPKLRIWYPKKSPFDLVAYSDSDYGGATQDRKSTTEGCRFLGRRLISWQCKKHTIVATSTTKAEYVAAASCCGQVLWIQNQLLDYGLSMPCEALSREFSISILCFNTIMARLQFCDYHNMVEILEKNEHNADFHPMVDFIEASPLRRTRIAQSSVLPTVADEPASPLRDVSQEEACPTDSGFIAGQDRETIDKSFTLPHDSALQVTSPVADKGTQEVEINRLNERVKMLEDREGVAATRSGDDASIKGRSMNEGEAVTERISDDSEEMATVLTSMDAATVLASGVVNVPTGSGSIPTTNTPAEEQVPTGSDVVPTTSPVFATATVVTPYRRRKGKEVMVESKTLKKQKVQEQMDAQVARKLEEQLERERGSEKEYHQFALDLPIERRIELITDLVKYQDNYAKIYKYQIQQRKPMTKKQRRDYYMAVIRNNLGWKVKDFRGMTFKEVEAKFNSVWKQIEDFIPMGSKEEAERIKRKGLNLEQDSAKKQKTSEEVPEEAMSPEKVPKEKVKEMMHLVPIEEVYVEALQVKHPIIDWKVHTEGQRSYWKITSNRPPTSDKEMELWVELSRLYEPDNEDQLWTHTQNFMHAPLEWKLYDTCGVHHVTSKDKEIFMIVEKDYPLRKGLALLMISYKLQVKNYSQMANDLILKIYKIANSPRQQEQLPIASEESCHCQKKSEAIARKIALLSKVKKKLSVKVK